MNTEGMTEFSLTIDDDVYTLFIKDSEVNSLRRSWLYVIGGGDHCMSLSAYDSEGTYYNFLIPRKILRKHTLIIKVKP